MNAKFDSKSFNPEAFGYMVRRVPNMKMNQIKKSKALAGNTDIRGAFSGDGTHYARIAMRGLIDGDAVNYDGQTDIPATSTKTFEQGVVVVGRAKAWVEKDFSYDITGGQDFMENVAQQIAAYKDGLDEDTILAVLEGIFKMTGTKNLEFVTKHTYDITKSGTGVVSATTLNTATQQACGDNKKKFTLCFMHSAVATNLENLKLLEHLKYTDKDGLTRDLDLGTWNGKLVVIDDGMPVINVPAVEAVQAVQEVKGVYTLTVTGAVVADDVIKIKLGGATVVTYTADGAGAVGPVAATLKTMCSGNAALLADYVITSATGKVIFTQKVGGTGAAITVEVTKGAAENTAAADIGSSTASVAGVAAVAAVEAADAYSYYVTYVLGDGAIGYEDIGAKKPYAMARDEATNGGQDTLYIRQRKCFSPFGISYEKVSQASLSPTDAELKNGANWTIAHSGEVSEGDRSFINHRAIPIARILSKG
jgi:hypothetical protein